MQSCTFLEGQLMHWAYIRRQEGGGDPNVSVPKIDHINILFCKISDISHYKSWVQAGGGGLLTVVRYIPVMHWASSSYPQEANRRNPTSPAAPSGKAAASKGALHRPAPSMGLGWGSLFAGGYRAGPQGPLS